MTERDDPKNPAGAAAGRCVVALERRLRHCGNVITLGVRTNLSDYGPEALALIREADRIYYPSAFYANLFNAMGKSTFPSAHNYHCAQDKIRQSTLFGLLGLPHPRTRVFYGRRQKEKILQYFQFPFVAKIPRGSSMGRGVYLIHNPAQLDDYCRLTHAAYIQQYLPVDRDLRVVVIGRQVVHAYWRLAPDGDFRANLARGGKVDLAPVPKAACDLARHTARACGWDDVGIDICCCQGQYYVIEANMKYGLEGFRQAGLDYSVLMERLIRDGSI